MLQLIHQNGLQKLNADAYFVDAREVGDPNNKETGPEIAYTIVATVPSVGMVDVAQYDKLEDARDIFYAMIACEINDMLCFLPLDDSEKIKSFINATQSLDKTPISFDIKKETK